MRRVAAFGAACLLAFTACGSTPPEELSEGEIFDGTGTTPPPGAIPTTAPAAGGPTVVPADGGLPAPSGSVARPRPGGGGGATPAPPTTVNPRRAQGPTGSFAPVLLREDLTVEVLTQSGAEPLPAAMTHLQTNLSEVAGRSVGTSGPTALDGGARNWTADELIALADSKATRPAGSATIRMLFVRGTLEGNSGVLGVAVRGDVIAIFSDGVHSAGGVFGNYVGVERAVLLHEAGHVLGLVDLYLKTGRADPDHPGHSSNKESVMYWAVETDAISSVLGANPPDTFDDADKADLARIKSGS